MSTSRVSDRAKESMRRIQERWRRLRGRAPPQEELIDLATQFVEDHWDLFLGEKGWKPLSEDRMRRLDHLAGDYGALSVDIDRTVYESE